MSTFPARQKGPADYENYLVKGYDVFIKYELNGKNEIIRIHPDFEVTRAPVYPSFIISADGKVSLGNRYVMGDLPALMKQLFTRTNVTAAGWSGLSGGCDDPFDRSVYWTPGKDLYTLFDNTVD